MHRGVPDLLPASTAAQHRLAEQLLGLSKRRTCKSHLGRGHKVLIPFPLLPYIKEGPSVVLPLHARPVAAILAHGQAWPLPAAWVPCHVIRLLKPTRSLQGYWRGPGECRPWLAARAISLVAGTVLCCAPVAGTGTAPVWQQNSSATHVHAPVMQVLSGWLP